MRIRSILFLNVVILLGFGAKVFSMSVAEKLKKAQQELKSLEDKISELKLSNRGKKISLRTDVKPWTRKKISKTKEIMRLRRQRDVAAKTKKRDLDEEKRKEQQIKEQKRKQAEEKNRQEFLKKLLKDRDDLLDSLKGLMSDLEKELKKTEELKPMLVPLLKDLPKFPFGDEEIKGDIQKLREEMQNDLKNKDDNHKGIPKENLGELTITKINIVKDQIERLKTLIEKNKKEIEGFKKRQVAIGDKIKSFKKRILGGLYDYYSKLWYRFSNRRSNKVLAVGTGGAISDLIVSLERRGNEIEKLSGDLIKEEKNIPKETTQQIRGKIKELQKKQKALLVEKRDKVSEVNASSQQDKKIKEKYKNREAIVAGNFDEGKRGLLKEIGYLEGQIKRLDGELSSLSNFTEDNKKKIDDVRNNITLINNALTAKTKEAEQNLRKLIGDYNEKKRAFKALLDQIFYAPFFKHLKTADDLSDKMDNECIERLNDINDNKLKGLVDNVEELGKGEVRQKLESDIKGLQKKINDLLQEKKKEKIEIKNYHAEKEKILKASQTSVDITSLKKSFKIKEKELKEVTASLAKEIPGLQKFIQKKKKIIEDNKKKIDIVEKDIGQTNEKIKKANVQENLISTLFRVYQKRILLFKFSLDKMPNLLTRLDDDCINPLQNYKNKAIEMQQNLKDKVEGKSYEKSEFQNILERFSILYKDINETLVEKEKKKQEITKLYEIQKALLQKSIEESIVIVKKNIGFEAKKKILEEKKDNLSKENIKLDKLTNFTSKFIEDNVTNKIKPIGEKFEEINKLIDDLKVKEKKEEKIEEEEEKPEPPKTPTKPIQEPKKTPKEVKNVEVPKTLRGVITNFGIFKSNFLGFEDYIRRIRKAVNKEKKERKYLYKQSLFDVYLNNCRVYLWSIIRFFEGSTGHSGLGLDPSAKTDFADIFGQMAGVFQDTRKNLFTKKDKTSVLNGCDAIFKIINGVRTRVKNIYLPKLKDFQKKTKFKQLMKELNSFAAGSSVF